MKQLGSFETIKESTPLMLPRNTKDSQNFLAEIVELRGFDGELSSANQSSSSKMSSQNEQEVKLGAKKRANSEMKSKIED